MSLTGSTYMRRRGIEKSQYASMLLTVRWRLEQIASGADRNESERMFAAGSRARPPNFCKDIQSDQSNDYGYVSQLFSMHVASV